MAQLPQSRRIDAPPLLDPEAAFGYAPCIHLDEKTSDAL